MPLRFGKSLQSLSNCKNRMASGQVKKAVFKLAAEEVNDLVQRTPFTRKEILKLHTRFQALSAQGFHSLTAKEVMNIEEMRANPFAPRICELFSEDGSGDLSFEKFLNMMAVFSHRTDPEIKMTWAFAIWDFDGDDVIGPGDIKKGLDLMCNGNYNRQGYALDQSSSHLSDEELSNIVNRVSAEIDPHHWGVSYHDFRGVLSRMPDFISNFRISI